MKMNRRRLLKMLATAPVAVAGLSFALPAAAKSEAAAAVLRTGSICKLTPEVTEGPFYFDPGMLRTDIREDRPGIPMKLRIQVVGTDCRVTKNI